jgi:hypothetical protein
MQLTVLARSCFPCLCSPLPSEHLLVALVAACLEHHLRYIYMCLDCINP